jgi:hypothetical protein
MKSAFYFFFFSIILLACSPESGGSFSFPNNNSNNNNGQQGNTGGNWLVPQSEIFDGGPGKDGIPSIDSPVFISPEEVDFISEDDLVIAISFESEIKVYPHAILDWHEIVNDEIGDHYFSLTYCPLTGTAINWNRSINGKITEFGVSGLLYNSNLIPYDRSTQSNWSQMRLDCINGELQGQQVNTFALLESTWATVKNLDNIKVLSAETGFNRDYGRYPYGDYKTNNDFLLFPVSNEDSRLPNKDRVLGVIKNETVKGYSFDDFFGKDDELIFDIIGGEQILVVGNNSKNFINAYYPRIGASYTLLRNQFPDILEDNLGNIYNVFGEVSSGPNPDYQLERPVSFIGYWFAWAAFYPDIIIRD